MQAKKNILIPIFILIIIASICFIIISFKNKNNISDNTITNSALTKEYNIDGILIYDIKLYVSDNVSKLMAKVKNANKDDVSDNSFACCKEWGATNHTGEPKITIINGSLMLSMHR